MNTRQEKELYKYKTGVGTTYINVRKEELKTRGEGTIKIQDRSTGTKHKTGVQEITTRQE